MPAARRAAVPGGRVLPGLLLLGTVGGLGAAAVATLLATPDPARGVVTTAVVTTSVSCADGGQDQVAVLPPGRAPSATAVPASLDACGQPAGATISVQVSADGTVGPVVTLAGTRAADPGSDLPALGLGAAVLLASAAAAVGLAPGRRSGPAGTVGTPG